MPPFTRQDARQEAKRIQEAVEQSLADMNQPAAPVAPQDAPSPNASLPAGAADHQGFAPRDPSSPAAPRHSSSPPAAHSSPARSLPPAAISNPSDDDDDKDDEEMAAPAPAPAQVDINQIARTVVRGVWNHAGALAWVQRDHHGSLPSAFQALGFLVLTSTAPNPYRIAVVAELLALRAEVDPYHDPNWAPEDLHTNRLRRANAVCPVMPAGPLNAVQGPANAVAPLVNIPGAVNAAGPLPNVGPPVGLAMQVAPAGPIVAAAAAAAPAPNIIPPIQRPNGDWVAQFTMVNNKLVCPIQDGPKCPAGCATRDTMKRHIKRNHNGFYRQVYGVDPTPDTPCTHPGCTFEAATAGQIPDHLLMVHGVEEPHKMKTPGVVRRMKVGLHLNPKYQALAQTTNALKRRIDIAEGQLAARMPGGYARQHGLSTVLRSESGSIQTDPGAQVALAAVITAGLTAGISPQQQYLANMLVDARIEADEVGMLLGGGQGSYAQVAQELESIVANLP